MTRLSSQGGHPLPVPDPIELQDLGQLADFGAHAKQITQIASAVAMDHFRNSLDVSFKSDESPVTQADKAVEAAVLAYLEGHFPDHGVYGEEYGQKRLNSEYLWVVDPIDGTRSFLSGHPLFGFLLALLQNSEPQIGIVAMPALSEVYLGVKGKGAWLNADSISVSNTTQLDRSILYVNEGDKIFQNEPRLFNRLMKSGQTRRFGYDCYPHALLAAGHIDVVFDYDLQPYDFMSVSALVQAAGGVVTDWAGKPVGLSSDGRIISASTPELHQQALALIKA
ncbi:inositol monophosphatase family protein [Ruegeria sp. EL01]|jgi:histidinol phosphatase-like enzyme (inositol monophosphatase family)|uniref:inositol monophosphatase family protein n=1 Tax=Ruegeria sp. EL01 TaxID=2107578 RepID=UPI000EA80CB3|nr:inositol monophosphatase family protein [Ruegeria sp. EL01]